MSSLDDVKTNPQTDSNAARQMALDHLGVIAAKIRSSILKFHLETGNRTAKNPLKPLDEVSKFMASTCFWRSKLCGLDRIERQFEKC